MKWERIREDAKLIIERKSLTQNQAAKQMGLDPGNFSRFLGGQRIHVEALEKLMDWMNGSFDDYRGDSFTSWQTVLGETSDRLKQRARTMKAEHQRPCRSALKIVAETLEQVMSKE